MRLVAIPNYEDYRIDAMFDCYKWDPQFLDHNTLSRYALVLTEQEAKEVAGFTEKLDIETRNAEAYLNHHLELTKKLKIPRQIKKELKRMKNYDAEKHIRLMRYDFHPTQEHKWVISEVNSDVPGGFAEASLLPLLACNYINSKKYVSMNFGDCLATAITNKIKPKGTIMFVHCTSYSDDRQVMQYIGDHMETLGYRVIYGASDHIQFQHKEAVCILDGYQEKIDCIVRFTPLEWLKDMKPKTWGGYFDTVTPSCNHPIAIFAQTKRFPLIWDELEKHGIQLNTWKQLLPHTIEVKEVKGKSGYIYKPAWGRVGEKISIQEACDEEEYQAILKDVKKHPSHYLAQQKFHSMPLKSPDGTYFHVCLGSYTVDGKHAGFYARMSEKSRIDSEAEDIPVLIERSHKNGSKRNL